MPLGMYSSQYKSPLGDITLASNGKALIGLWFLTSSVFDNKVLPHQARQANHGSPSGCDGQRHFGSTLVCNEELRVKNEDISLLPFFDEVRRWLDIYFSGHEPDFMPPLSLTGTAFQQRVWKELLTIPYGQTVTYGELARRLGCRSAQAVGGAVGRNPISIIVPCHRVIGANGNLTGYAGGLDKKRALLTLENPAK